MVIIDTFCQLGSATLEALEQDSAGSSSFFVITATDILGFLVFFGLTKLFPPLRA